MIPSANEIASLRSRDPARNQFHFTGWDLRGKDIRAVAIPKQRDEVQSWRDALAAGNLLEANRHDLLVPASRFADPPAEVDGLKSGSMCPAQVTQPREDVLSQRLPLYSHVAECGADENAERLVTWHGS